MAEKQYDIDLTRKQFAILGLRGGGKTTLARHLLGTVPSEHMVYDPISKLLTSTLSANSLRSIQRSFTMNRIERLEAMTYTRWREVGKLVSELNLDKTKFIEDTDWDTETKADAIARFPMLSRNYEPSCPDPSLVL